jgi:hypothetical protein
MLKACVAVAELLSVARTVMFEVPDPVGVPLTTPVDDILKPAGKVPEARLHVQAPVPPTAARTWE